MPRTVFVCEFCDKRYSSREAAESCEQQHLEEAKRIGFEVAAVGQGSSIGYPERIYIQRKVGGGVHEYTWTRATDIDNENSTR